MTQEVLITADSRTPRAGVGGRGGTGGRAAAGGRWGVGQKVAQLR